MVRGGYDLCGSLYTLRNTDISNNAQAKKRKHRIPSEENRSFVECPYCKKKFYAKMQRHLLSVHKDLVKSKVQANATTTGSKKIPRVEARPANETMKAIRGEKREDPEKKSCKAESACEWF